MPSPDAPDARFSLSQLAIRRIAAGLCLAACGGFLLGTFRERWKAAVLPRPFLPAVSITPTPDAPPGDLMGDDPFTAPAAKAMEAGDYQRALGYYRSALIDADSEPARARIADQLHALGVSAHMRDKGQGRVSIAALEEALSLYHQLKLANSALLANTVADLADAVSLRGDRKRTTLLWDEAVDTGVKSGDQVLQADIDLRAGDYYCGIGEYSQGHRLLTDALMYFRGHGDKRGVAHSLRFLAGIDFDKGRYPEARTKLTESARLLAEIGEIETRAAVLGTLGDAWVRDGKASLAAPLYKEGLSVWQSRHQQFWTAVFLSRLGTAAYVQNDLAQAELLGKQSLRLLQDSNGVLARNAPLYLLGNVARKRGEFRQAILLHEESLALRRKGGNPRSIAEGCEALAEDLKRSGEIPALRRSHELLQEAEALRVRYDLPSPPATKL